MLFRSLPTGERKKQKKRRTRKVSIAEILEECKPESQKALEQYQKVKLKHVKTMAVVRKLSAQLEPIHLRPAQIVHHAVKHETMETVELKKHESFVQEAIQPGELTSFTAVPRPPNLQGRGNLASNIYLEVLNLSN